MGDHGFGWVPYAYILNSSYDKLTHVGIVSTYIKSDNNKNDDDPNNDNDCDDGSDDQSDDGMDDHNHDDE